MDVKPGKVRARADLLETDGRRFLFRVEAFDEVEKVMEGKHERFMVPSLKKFLDRAAKKAKRSVPAHPFS
ncbi:MAG: thioesterase family protein [Candidatus Methylomirabilia bacterium]